MTPGSGSGIRFGLLAVSVFALCIACGQGRGAEPAGSEPVRILFDSDMAGDADDVAALAVLHALADQGHAKILAVGASERNPWTPLCMDAINTYYGRPEIPIGVTKDKGAFFKRSKYTKAVARNFPRSQDWESANDVPSAVAIYRDVLATQPDDSVVLVTVGSLANIANLLKSKPDEHSDLSGKELVKKKVRHWVCMAGVFGPGEGRREANLIKGVKAAQYALEHWPTRITFCGYLIGHHVQTGADLSETSEDNPVRHAYKLGKGGRSSSSFDQVTTLFAVRALDGGPLANLWKLSDWGVVEVNGDGSNKFKEAADGPHRYIRPELEHRDPEQVEKIVEELMTRPPKRG